MCLIIRKLETIFQLKLNQLKVKKVSFKEFNQDFYLNLEIKLIKVNNTNQENFRPSQPKLKI